MKGSEWQVAAGPASVRGRGGEGDELLVHSCGGPIVGGGGRGGGVGMVRTHT